MRKTRYTKEDVEILIEQRQKTDYPELSIDWSTYQGFSNKCKFIDSEYGEWIAYCRDVVLRNQSHRKRANKNIQEKHRIPIEKIKEKLFLVHGDLVLIDESTYIDVRKDARFIDKEYGEFWAAPYYIYTYKARHPIVGKQTQGGARNSETYIKNRLKEIYGDEVIIDWDTYKTMNVKAKFIHSKHGEWWATPSNVLRGHSHKKDRVKKTRETFLKKYGVPNAMQNREVLLKSIKSKRQKVILIHWKTQKEVLCNCSYEYAVINKLNELKIDYEIQIQFHLEELNCKYFMDLYVKDWNLYVEIKGRPYEDGILKFETFHKKYPNSEIWGIDKISKFVEKSDYFLKKDYKKILNEQKLLLERTNLP